MSAKSFANLPTDLLEKIFDNLFMDFDNLLSCTLVCVSWQSAIRLLYPPKISDAADQKKKRIYNFPLLILLPPENETGRQCCRIYNTYSCKIHRIFLPQLQGGWYTASSHYWLLAVANQGIYLVNPITSATVRLPPEKRFRKPEIFRVSSKRPEYTRVITSNVPTDPQCKVLAIHPGKYGHSFSFCRTGDRAWIRINNFVGRCFDAIFYKGDFYAIDFYGCIWVIQPNVNSFQKAAKLSVEPVGEGCNCYYLAEVKGDLLMVEMPQGSFSSYYFYRMDWEKKSWVSIKKLDGDFNIFLGRFCSYWEESGSTSIYFLNEVSPEFPSPPDCCYAVGRYDPRIRNFWLWGFSVYDPPPQEAIEGISTANWITWYKLHI